MLRYFVGRIQKGLSLFVARRPAFNYFSEDRATTAAQDDVMEGYFAVLAIKGEETKRFIIGLDYLNDPAFLGLLNEAQEEYGFRQQGALALPCPARITEDPRCSQSIEQGTKDEERDGSHLNFHCRDEGMDI